MAELIATMAAEVTNVQNELAAVDNVNERGQIKYTVLDPVTFQLVAHRKGPAFLVKIAQLLSYNPPQNRRVIFDENDTKSLGWFSFHLLSMHHLVYAHALVGCPTMCPNRMGRSIEPNLTKIALSMTPI